MWLPSAAQVDAPLQRATRLLTDSLATDTLPYDPLDSIRQKSPIRGLVRFSADTLQDLVEYNARDSIRLDNVNHLIYLYGQASIKYQTYSITADYILVDLDSSTALAEQLPDSLKPKDLLRELQEDQAAADEPPEEETIAVPLYDTIVNGFDTTIVPRARVPVEKERNENGMPHFDDGTSQFDAKRLRYNFKTRKGKIYDVITQESNMFIHGSQTKFVSGGADTTSNDYVYSTDVLLTTCDAEHPHYGIRSRRQKIIPNRQVIVGPSNLEIAGVPTPFILPFGFFPISKGAKNGLIFPSDYEYSEQWGFGLREIGYYFPINDNIDLTLTGDIYFNGSWGLRAKSNYRKRYKYSGNFDIGYSNRKGETFVPELGLQKSKQKSFSIRWSHNQDQRARPGQTFQASVSMQTNGFEQLNYNDQRVLNNQYSSNVSFRKRFEGTPFNLSANLRHSQNSNTGQMQFTLPDINVTMNRIFPFERKKNRSPQAKWYEKISLQYSGKFLNRIRTQDSLLFQQSLFKDAEFGANHNLNSSASFRILKYFNITPSVDYEESWYFKTIQKTFEPGLDIVYDTLYSFDSMEVAVIATDTLSLGEVLSDTINGLKPLRQFTSSISLSTTIFGQLGANRTKGWFRGVRHVVKPTISFNYSPDYTDPDLGYVGTVQSPFPGQDDEIYSIFEGALFGSPPTTGRRMAMSYSINNLFEAKVFSKKDSTEKKFKLLNTISITGSHNFVADSLKWSMVNLRGSGQMFKGISRVQFSARWDPYAVNENGRRINTKYWDAEGKLLRFDMAALRVSNGLTIDNIRSLIKGEGLTNQTSRGRNDDRSGEELESLTDLFKDFRINHDFVLMWDVDQDGRKKAEIRTNSINTRGNIRLTPNWDLSIGNIGYDFKTKRITYPYLGFTRNLHCWEMGFNWAPQRSTYSFFIRVRQAPLNFIKIPYRKGNQDTRFLR